MFQYLINQYFVIFSTVLFIYALFSINVYFKNEKILTRKKKAKFTFLFENWKIATKTWKICLCSIQ